MQYKNTKRLIKIYRLFVSKKTHCNSIQEIENMVMKYFTSIADKPYFRTSPNSRKRIMSFEQFKELYLKHGKEEDEDILRDFYASIGGSND